MTDTPAAGSARDPRIDPATTADPTDASSTATTADPTDPPPTVVTATTADPTGTTDPTNSTGTAPPVAGPFGLPSTVGVVDLLAVVAMFLLPTAVLPSVDSPMIVPKLAVLVPFVGIGLVLLVDLARRGDRPARAGVVLAATWILAGLLAPSTFLAFVGGYSIDRGVIVLIGYLGLWALGRSVDPATRPLLLGAAFAALVSNVAVGVVQLTVDLGRSFLSVGDSARAAGLTPSSVYLGGVCAAGAGAAAAVAARARTTARTVVAVGLVFVASAGANLTGSRIAVVAVLAVGVAAVVVRRAGWRRGAVIVAALVAGLVVSVPGDATTTTSRTTSEAGAGVGTRTEMWRHGVDAWVDRPLTGWGPGRFREATSPRITRTFAVDEGPDKLFFDAHNGPIEMLTTTGLLGVLALGAFVLLAARRARGALAWLAAAVAVTWLAEPISISAASMAMLALGASYRGPPDPTPSTGSSSSSSSDASAASADDESVAAVGAGRSAASSGRRRAPIRGLAMGAGALPGVVVAVAMVWAGTHMLQAFEQADRDAVHEAKRVYQRDSAVSDLESQILYGDYGVDGSPRTLQALLESTQRAVDQDPTYHLWWIRLGTVQRMAGDLDGSRDSFATALDLNPWSIAAWYGIGETAEQLGDEDLVAEAAEKTCLLDRDLCE